MRMTVKNYIYEIVDGKRKRVSPFIKSEDGETIIAVKKGAIIDAYDFHYKDPIIIFDGPDKTKNTKFL